MKKNGIFQRLLFVRHGKTDWNELMRYQGKSDIPLNDTGLYQARNTSLRISSLESIDAVYSSPLTRAFQTAEIINSKLKTPVNIQKMENLSEMNFGSWEGSTASELKIKDAERYRSWRKDPVGVTPPGGEKFADICERVEISLEDILSSGNRTVIVVSHGGVIRAALKVIMGLDSTVIWRLRLDNCSISIIDIWNKTTTLVTWNDHIHTDLPFPMAKDIPLPL